LKSLWKDFSREFEDNTLAKFRYDLRNVEREVMVSYMIEGSNDRAVVQAEREGRERQRKGELSTTIRHVPITDPSRS
jgi:hypothetical protein